MAFPCWWATSAAATCNDRLRSDIADAVTELRRLAIQAGPHRLDRIAVLLADMARTVASQQTDLDEMRDLIAQASPADDVSAHLTDLQDQINRLQARLEARP